MIEEIGKGAVGFCDEVIGNFHWINPSGRTRARGFTQPLTAPNKNEYKVYFWGVGIKVAGAWDLQPYPLHMPIV